MKTSNSVFGGLMSALGLIDDKSMMRGVNPAVALLSKDDVAMFFNIKSDGEALRAEERKFERFARMYTSISPSEKRALVIYTSVMAKFRREWPVRQLTARRVIKNYADSINYTFEVYSYGNKLLERVSFTTSK